MGVSVHPGGLRSSCNCHSPERQPACLHIRTGNLRDWDSRISVANSRMIDPLYRRVLNPPRSAAAGDARDRRLRDQTLMERKRGELGDGSAPAYLQVTAGTEPCPFVAHSQPDGS